MRYVLSGRTYQITDLDPALDQLFPALHAAYLGGTPFSWQSIHPPAEKYLAQSNPRSVEHNAYFNNFTLVWNHLLASGRFDEAETLWEMALQPALNAERASKGHEIHKGTAYYYWGITAILRGDIDKGYALMHQAVEEDVATEKTEFPKTPAYALATLDWTNQNQAFRQWVVTQAEFLNDKQNLYSSRYARAFTLEDFRQRFLASPPSTDVVFLFAYTVARLMRLGTAPEYTVRSRFSAQLFINIFFDIALAIETAVKVKNPGGNSFIDHAEYLSALAACPLSNAQLRELNASFRQDFDVAILSLLDGSYTFSDRSKPTGMQLDIAVAYGIRNRAAHDVSPTPAIAQRFNDVMQALLNVMFLTVDFAYK